MVFNLLEIWLFFKYCEIAAVWKLKEGRKMEEGRDRKRRQNGSGGFAKVHTVFYRPG
jgi:hypothetical protein